MPYGIQFIGILLVIDTTFRKQIKLFYFFGYVIQGFYRNPFTKMLCDIKANIFQLLLCQS